MTLADLNLNPNGIYTYADYLTWQVAERIELIKGKIWKMSPAPSSYHQRMSTKLIYRLQGYFEDKSCEVFAAPFDVTFTKAGESKEAAKTVLQPDLCVICDLSKIDQRGCNGAPELVVEILSPGNSRHEMKRKYAIYEEYGVQEYWVVHPEEETVQIYTLEDGIFRGHQPVFKEDTISSHLFPDFCVDLKDIF